MQTTHHQMVGTTRRLVYFAVRGDKGHVFDQGGGSNNAVGRIFRIGNW